MKLKVGDKVQHIEETPDEQNIGTVIKISARGKVTIEWNSMACLPYPWTIDGKFGGKYSDGQIALRLVTPLEELL